MCSYTCMNFFGHHLYLWLHAVNLAIHETVINFAIALANNFVADA